MGQPDRQAAIRRGVKEKERKGEREKERLFLVNKLED
jgi:hypothetical protein